MGIVVGYLPTIYSAFSRREIEISLLDARAGSPPTAAELLRRYGRHGANDQSWLTALTTILDATALVAVGIDGMSSEQAKMTFAMARHAVVDLSQGLLTRYDPLAADRLPADELLRLRRFLSDKGLKLHEGSAADEKLSVLRAMYEPYVEELGKSLPIALPPWLHGERKLDNWQVAPWDEAVSIRGATASSAYSSEEHF